MKICDWLLLLYIFKWSDFWIAPKELFIYLWIIFILKIFIKIIRECFNKKQNEEFENIIKRKIERFKKND